MELTADDVRARLSAAVRELGSQRALARRAGVSEPYLCDVLRGRRSAGNRLLAAIDLIRVERFVSIRGGL
ncbi:transcriptional regulator [uncultured Methylobacterium sp.]|uniref:transcriptional regulator n=1 Tax=uncultured Methylobacterium sp. TaxID=157278 RepID=UPI0025934463|nr:transcriptional regulator [uncultured Methylobacterium sp.]